MVALTVRVGADAEPIMNGRLPETPPPGTNTVTLAVPAAVKSDAGMAAVNFVAFTNVVGRSAPFQRTIEFAVNPLPFTVSVNAGLPTVALAGSSDVRIGAPPTRFTAGLVAARSAFTNKRNSNGPPLVGTVTVQVRVVIPVPTYVHCR